MVEEVRKAPGFGMPGAVQTKPNKLQIMMEDSELNFQSFQQRVAITYTLQALQRLAQALAGFPGRKSLIWASGGFPFSVSDNTMQLAPAGRDTLADVLPSTSARGNYSTMHRSRFIPSTSKDCRWSTSPSASIRNPGKNYARHMNGDNGYPVDSPDVCVR